MLLHSLARQCQTTSVFLKSISDPQHPSVVPRETAGVVRQGRFDRSEDEKGEVRCEHVPSLLFNVLCCFVAEGAKRFPPHASNPSLNPSLRWRLSPWPKHWSRRQECCIQLAALPQAIWMTMCRSQVGDLISLSYMSTGWK